VTEGNISEPHWERRNPFRKKGTYSDRAGLDRFAGAIDFRIRLMDHKQNSELKIDDLPSNMPTNIERRYKRNPKGTWMDRRDRNAPLIPSREFNTNIRKEDNRIVTADPELEKIETSKTEIPEAHIYGSEEWQINRRKAVVTNRRHEMDKRREGKDDGSGQYRRTQKDERRMGFRREEEIDITTPAQPREPQFYGELILDPPKDKR
jgi:hypothetical protein